MTMQDLGASSVGVGGRPGQRTQDAGRSEQGRTRRGLLVVAVVGIIGIASTVAACWVASRENQDATQKILRIQTRQAGEVLVAAIPTAVDPLATGAVLAFNSHDPAQAFRSYLQLYISPVGFADASLWTDRAQQVTVVATLGTTPDVAVPSSKATSLDERAPSCRTSFSVTEVTGAGTPRFAFACSIGSGSDRYVVYGERRLPANRHAMVASNSAFSELRYAIYFGRSTRASDLVATDFATLPPPQPTSRVSVRYGTGWLTIVAGPNGNLAGSLSSDLPWFVGVVGLLFTLVAGLMTRSLVQGRVLAEDVAAETRELNLEVVKLLADQQAIAGTLQRSLLPLRTPQIPGITIAARYVPGSDGLEVGGDWYSIVRIDDYQFGFVVGDVSGHSIQAAAVMAALRFTIRALILEGHPPATVLNRCSAQVQDLLRGHLATALVGVADQRTRRVDLGNAGHLRPLLVTPDGASFVETRGGVPLGVTHLPYVQSSFVMPAGATLLSFTDGLIERRREGLDTSLERLRVLAEDERHQQDVEVFLGRIVEGVQRGHRLDDDLAVLAVRWP